MEDKKDLNNEENKKILAENELKLRQFIFEVAILEIPALKLFVALQQYSNGDIKEDTTFGVVLTHYINKVENLKQYFEEVSIDNFNKAYEEFIKIFNNEIDPLLTELVNKSEKN